MHYRTTEDSLKSFAQGRGRTPITAVTCKDIEKWMAAHEWAPKTARTYRWDVRTLFNVAVRRSYLDRNPAEGVEPPVVEETAQSRFSRPRRSGRSWRARRNNLDACRHLALRFFAGIRTSEAHRLGKPI